jgi:hypothetical protein
MLEAGRYLLAGTAFAAALVIFTVLGAYLGDGPVLGVVR